MIKTIDFDIPEFRALKKVPNRLYFEGHSALLKKQKISIIGTRRPIAYTKTLTNQLAGALAKRGIVIVSGAAMGVDALAHQGAGVKNTIAVMPCGLSHRYPATNRALIEKMSHEGLVMSQFENDFKATPWSFVVRNELVVALGDVLIVTQCDVKSGSMRSIEYALAQGKKIYVLPHRVGDSEGTNRLVAQGQAEVIYNIDTFVSQFGDTLPISKTNDDFMNYCTTNPPYEEAIAKYPSRVFEAELMGEIMIKDAKVMLL
jgi:DNA processing protein